MNPTNTEYDKVKTRTKIVREIADEIVNPWMLRRPINVPSKTPIPAGMNEATPRIIEVA